MHWYRMGQGEGRFIGRTASFDVYPSVLSSATPELEEQERNLGPSEMRFNYGPSTGGLVESVNFSIDSPGELITGIAVNPYYKRRKLKLSGTKPEDALLLVERINGFHCASNSISFILAVEDALDISVPESVSMRRIIQIEMERIRSNLTVMERLCSAAGFGVPHNQLAAMREKVSRIIGNAAGHRYMFGTGMIGGIGASFSGVAEELEPLINEFRSINESLLQSKIFINRLQGNGKASKGNMLGPAARSAGFRYDARSDSESLPYSRINFQPIIRHEGDAFGRFMVRAEEIFSSMGLIERAAELSEGSDAIEPVHPEIRGGTGAARVESPQGDLFVFTDIKDYSIRRVEIMSPGKSNIGAFRRSSVGTIFTDFPFNWESFGIWISEVGVELE